jgi:hypothetical protein
MVANNPEFNAYAHEHYILDDSKVAEDDANGYFYGGKDEVMDEYFFDHLKDDHANEDHGEREDCCIKLDWDVFTESRAAFPEQDVTTQSA